MVPFLDSSEAAKRETVRLVGLLLLKHLLLPVHPPEQRLPAALTGALWAGAQACLAAAGCALRHRHIVSAVSLDPATRLRRRTETHPTKDLSISRLS